MDYSSTDWTGCLSTNDYDAVNVAQLKASMTTLSSTDGSVKITPNITMMDPGLF